MQKKPLVLIPGLLNDAELWRDQIADLSDIAACQVADITRGSTLEELARSVLNLSPPSFALAGFSLGGYVAVEMVRLAPRRIERLALLDTSIRADTLERRARRQAVNAAAMAPGRFHGFGEGLLATYLAASNLKDQSIVARIRGMTSRLGSEVFLRQNSIERKDGAEVLRSLTCPVLIVCGEHDVRTPFSDHQAMARLPQHCELVSIPAAGHMTPIENPVAVSAALRKWIL